MKILSADQIKEVDNYTILHEPIASGDLMERASTACKDWIVSRYSSVTPLKIFIGPGNNGGDGLVLAYQLLSQGYSVKAFLLFPTDNFSADALSKYEKLKTFNAECLELVKDNEFPVIEAGDLLIDAIFGTGINKPIGGHAAHLIKYLNNKKATIISIDIPSGLMVDSNEVNSSVAIVEADYTLTFEFPKLSFFFAENALYTGEWHVLPIGLHPQGIALQTTQNFLQHDRDLKPIIKKRSRFSHKGHFGHAFLIAGSFGKIGAAVLASKSCLRAGCGLLTTHIPRKGYEILQMSTPETMVSLDRNYDFIIELPEFEKYSAIGAGPGIGTSHETVDIIRELLSKAKVPLVLDADALNIMAENQWLLYMLPANTILTPHPKEFDRIVGEKKNGYNRYLAQIEFSKKYNVVIVLKGAYTSITSPQGECWFNSTGNQGMATAGSGDVLTGIILSLLAQGYAPLAAARLGVLLHGLAGDLALNEQSMESLLAGDIINYMGNAFKYLSN